jgi:hypothetical protein
LLQQAGALSILESCVLPLRYRPNVAGDRLHQQPNESEEQHPDLINGAEFINQNAGAGAQEHQHQDHRIRPFGNFADGKMIGLYTTEAFAAFLERA